MERALVTAKSSDAQNATNVIPDKKTSGSVTAGFQNKHITGGYATSATL